MEKEFIDKIEIIMSSLLLTILLMVTQRGWAGGNKVILIFIGGCISGYLFSGVPGYFVPELYATTLRTALNGITTIVSFMFLVYIFEKELLNQAFETVKIKYFDNKKEGQQD